MKCNIIKDLLPLYCDGLTSQDSNDEIEKHLADCESCTGVYESMKHGEESIKEEESDIQPLKKVRKRNILKIVSAVSATAVVLVTAFFFLFWGVIPISSDKLDMEFSVNETSYTIEEFDDDGKLINTQVKPVKELTIVFTGDCAVTNEKTDLEIKSIDSHSNFVNYEVTIYPVINLPFDDRGKYPNKFEYSVPVEEGDTLTIYCRDKTVTYKVTELAEMAEKENN